MNWLLDQARKVYDYVVVDTPPVIPVPDGGLLHRVVDGYLVVVGARSTPRKLLGEALNLLDPAAVMGLVYNRDEQPLFGYYRSRYRRYFNDYVRSLDRDHVVRPVTFCSVPPKSCAESSVTSVVTTRCRF
jgi:Mrp family chromosome partitioning ATPase